jgi:hypothetical protein
MVFARSRSRIQQAIVEIGDASSGFSNLWRWRSAVINAARSPTVIVTGCCLMGPNADPVYGRLRAPSACDLLSQHSPMWDEWSSPGELIHPGDLASIASIEEERDFAIAVMAIREEAPGNRGGGDSLS